jgi:hypothetical protein
MRIEIDFDNKVIEVKDSATLGELIDKLKELNLKDWKEYKLKQGNEYIGYPWVPYIPWYPFQPLQPYYPTWTTCELTYPLKQLEITY